MPVSSTSSGSSTPPAASQAGRGDRRPLATTTRSASSLLQPPPPLVWTPVTVGVRAPGAKLRASTVTPSSRRTLSWASTARRSTHSNVVRRPARATRSSSPGRAARSTMVGRHHVQEADLGHAGSEQGIEYVGIAVAQHVPQPGEQRMGVPYLGRAPPVPGERIVRIGRQRCGVALEHRDRVPMAGQGESRTEAGDPRSDHNDLCHVPLRSSAVPDRAGRA